MFVLSKENRMNLTIIVNVCEVRKITIIINPNGQKKKIAM
jgi:hypothetical protein